jgi:hypothetical protein
LYLMTRWFVVADVWWLAPQKIHPDESSIEFAGRVKAMISEAAGLTNLSWDGYMKNFMALKEQKKLKSSSQQVYGDILKRKLKRRGSEVAETSFLRDHMPDANRTEDHQRISMTSAELPLRLRRVTRANSESSRRVNVDHIEDYLRYLPEHSVTDLKNQLLKSSFADAPIGSNGASATNKQEPTSLLINDMNSSCLVQSLQNLQHSKKGFGTNYKLYLQSKEPSVITNRRIENTSWRIWFLEKKSVDLATTGNHNGTHSSYTPSSMDDVLGSLSDSFLSPYQKYKFQGS